jgi:hypothetical protein
MGCMGMSEFYGPSDDAGSLATLARALELGVTLLDTADIYGTGRNESLHGRYLRTGCLASPAATTGATHRCAASPPPVTRRRPRWRWPGYTPAPACTASRWCRCRAPATGADWSRTSPPPTLALTPDELATLDAIAGRVAGSRAAGLTFASADRT